MPEIRSDIPLPVRNSPTAELRKLSKVGDSIFLHITRNSLGQSARLAGLVGKYASRAEDGGLRIWRTKI